TTRRPPTPTLFPYTTLFRSALMLQGSSILSCSLPAAAATGKSGLILPALHGQCRRCLLVRSYQRIMCREEGSDSCHEGWQQPRRSEEHTSELQSRFDLVCRL